MSERAVQAYPVEDRYLQFLPEIYRTDEFTRNFLRIFESMLAPVEGMLDNLPDYFRASYAPEAMLATLCAWLGAATSPEMDVAQTRELLRRAIWLHQSRGTTAALAEHLRICIGVEVDIVDPGGIGVTDLSPFVTVTVPREETPELRRLAKSVIEAHLPVHLTYKLSFRMPEPDV